MKEWTNLSFEETFTVSFLVTNITKYQECRLRKNIFVEQENKKYKSRPVSRLIKHNYHLVNKMDLNLRNKTQDDTIHSCCEHEVEFQI